MNLDLHTAARALGGHVSGNQVLAPGPRHRPHDRSLAIKFDPTAPGGFLVHSHAGDDPLVCRDYVRERLGLPAWNSGQKEERPPTAGRIAPAVLSRIIAEYIFRQADGSPYLRVQRTDPKGAFPQSHWTGSGWASGKPRGPKIPYRLPELLDAQHGTVFICEGEKDVDNLAAIGLVATTNSEGACKWTEELNGYFAGRNAVILEDNDETGARHARQIADYLVEVADEVRVVKLPNLPPKGDVSDWLAAGATAAELIALCERSPLHGEEPIGLSAADLQTMTFPPIEYVVPGYVVEGLTLLAGKPKKGKSWLCLDWAIAVARGGITVGDVRCSEGDVLYAALEDNPRRLQSRMTKLLKLQPWPARLEFLTQMPRLNQGGVELIRNWIRRAKRPRLVIIDVLAKVRTPKPGAESTYEADYTVVAELKALADEHGIAIVLVHHQRKMEADDPLDSVSGTTGLTGAVDSVMVIVGDTQGTRFYARGRDLEEIDKSVELNAMTCRWHVLGDADEVRRTDERNAILAVLDDSPEPMGPNDIASAAAMKSGNVRRLLSKMEAAGEVVKEARGRYRSSTPGNIQSR